VAEIPYRPNSPTVTLSRTEDFNDGDNNSDDDVLKKRLLEL
jgi:hypothetical protein